MSVDIYSLYTRLVLLIQSAKHSTPYNSETMKDFILLILSLFLFIYVLLQCVRFYMKHCIQMCESNVSMDEKVIIVTGSNTGIGFHTAKDLASRGGRIILACRNADRGITARDKIIAETGNQKVDYMHLNLSSLKSVKEFAKEFIETEQRLDVLINNAGVHGLCNHYTEDNIIEAMQINFFGPFLLTLLLLPKLMQSRGRVVNLSSILHYFGVVNLDRINQVGNYNGLWTYNNSKLCMLLFTKELSRRVRGAGVTVNAVHPGVIATNIVSEKAPWWSRCFFTVWCWTTCRTAEEGAQTVIYLAIADECKNVSGEYYIDCKPRSVMFKVNNEELAGKLWNYAENLVGYRTPF